ncbi:MAG TPA: helix-turn-helix domain-containing protein [Trebonia sp.]|nr:helix-turn-helix domain-containing protein [Trebonia sp.]
MWPCGHLNSGRVEEARQPRASSGNQATPTRTSRREAFHLARPSNQACIDGHRLAERRKALGLTPAGVAARMGVTKSRVSQIERGEVSTIEAVARYVQATGGTIQISAIFGADREPPDAWPRLPLRRSA